MGPRASLTRGPPPETPDTGQQLAQKTHSKDAASASPETAARPTPQPVPLFQQSSRISSMRKSDQGQPEGPSEAGNAEAAHVVTVPDTDLGQRVGVRWRGPFPFLGLIP